MHFKHGSAPRWLRSHWALRRAARRGRAAIRRAIPPGNRSASPAAAPTTPRCPRRTTPAPICSCWPCGPTRRCSLIPSSNGRTARWATRSSPGHSCGKFMDPRPCQRPMPNPQAGVRAAPASHRGLRPSTPRCWQIDRFRWRSVKRWARRATRWPRIAAAMQRRCKPNGRRGSPAPARGPSSVTCKPPTRFTPETGRPRGSVSPRYPRRASRGWLKPQPIWRSALN